MRMKISITLLLSIIPLFSLLSQEQVIVSGTVKEKGTSESLIGVTVQIEGTGLGTVTDYAGSYSLSVPKDSEVTFSYVGMTPQKFIIEKSKTLHVILDVQATGLDEVVVIGYGTARKRDLTGSITSISGDELKSIPNNNPLKSLQGKVPGMLVANSGSAGASPTIQLRGVATVNADTKPLYIVDGMFLDNIDFINPNDITSIEVLKDPSSLAIFGVQGANGVIILTTRRADKGKLSVNYDGYYGSQILHDRDRVKLTNASEFTMLYNELLKNMDPAAAEWTPDLLGGGTDWQSLIFRSAPITNHSLSISQSNEKSSSVLSVGYFSQDGIVKYNTYKRLNARLVSDYNIGKYLKAGGSVALSRWDLDPKTASAQNAVRAIPTYSPYAPQSDHNPKNIGSYYTPSPGIQKDVANPVARMEIGRGNENSYGYRTTGSVYGEINFLKDFSFRVTGYADIGINIDSKFTPRFDVNNTTSNSSQKSDYTRFLRKAAEYKKYQADFILNYNKTHNQHRIAAMIGYTAREEENQGLEASADTIADGKLWTIPKDLWMLSMGSKDKKENKDWYNSSSFISYLARASYSYANKYLATATFRADGSSKFAKGHQWGYFPSLGLGWVISEETFFEPLKKNIDYLKLKTSWGRLGNDKIKKNNTEGSYLQYPTIDPKGQQVIVDGKVYYLPTIDYAVDTTLHWEIVSGFDIGIESRMFNNRMALEVGFYSKTTDDLLAFVPGSAGIIVPTVTNAGSLNNKGVEFMLSWQDKIGDFRYNMSVNGSTLKNEVLSLGNNNADIVSGKYHITRVGHSVGAMYGYEQDGIFQNQQEIINAPATSWISKPGDIRYKDLDGDDKITVKDRVFIGNTIPSFVYGFNVNLGYRSFDFAMDFNGVSGNKIINQKKLPSFMQFNFYETALERWHGEGTSNETPILDNQRGHNFLPSTNLLESGAYLRLRNIQLGYSLPKNIYKSLGLSSLRVYANVQNLLTFKSNTGFTPEIGGSILEGAIDNGGTYPIPTTYTVGLSVNF